MQDSSMHTSTALTARTYKRNLPQIAGIALSHITTLNIQLINRLEQKSPGNIFGWAKFEEMERVQKRAAFLCKNGGIPHEEKPLLELVLRAHDLGRPVQSLVRHYIEKGAKLPFFGKTTTQAIQTILESHQGAEAQTLFLALNVAHGLFSATLLNDHLTLAALSVTDRTDILSAVRYHSEAKLPEDQKLLSPRAHAWCTAMKAADTFDFFGRHHDVFEEPGISKEFQMHFSKVLPTLAESTAKAVDEKVISAFENGQLSQRDWVHDSGSMQDYAVFTLCRIVQLPAVMQRELFRRKLDQPLVDKLKLWECPAETVERVTARLEVLKKQCGAHSH
jgi:hypothetical protein